MNDNLARTRFLVIGVLRLGGVALAFLGIAVVTRRLIEPADAIGYTLIAIGVLDVMIVPLVLARRWRTPRL